MKVLIIHPEFKDPGGVANYFAALKGKLKVEAKSLVAGRRVGEKGFFSSILRLFCDYARFTTALRSEYYDIIHINPSLNFKGVVREGIFILIAKHYKRKVLVFFRGWHKHFEQVLERWPLWLFRLVYKRVDAFIVLADEFKNKLRIWGFEQPIYLATTAVDDNLLKNFDIKEAIRSRRATSKYKILFLSRLLKAKGIYETIDAVKLLQNKFSNIELIIAGDGVELEQIKSYLNENNVSNVVFAGYVRGEAKRKLFQDAYLYCFPTYEEGMPASVLGAMAFGLPVITRPVGGIVDFFENGKHGFIDESKDPAVFAGYIKRLLLDEQLYEKISLHNYEYAQQRFLASQVAERLEKIYGELLQ